MIKFNLGIEGYGLSLLIYEVLGASIQLLACLYLADRRSFDFSEPIQKNIYWLFLECVKNSSAVIFVCWAYDYYIIIVTLLHEPKETSLYALNNSFIYFAVYFSIGVLAYPKIQLNKYLSIQDFKGAKSLFYNFIPVLTLIMSVFIATNLLLVYFMKTWFPDKPVI